MNIKIHRGTKEIGGSCVEVWTENTRILVDFGMPLVESDGSEFDLNKYKNLSTEELRQKGILPDVNGVYKGSRKLIDALLISHPHQDHYGLSDYLHKKIPVYIGEATHKIIELSNIFTRQKITLKNCTYFTSGIPFSIGDFQIIPYLMDHSAFDSYAFHIKVNGKSIFYSGDFRGHGRKIRAFIWFLHHAPKRVDYLLLEGTMIGRSTGKERTEEEIQQEFQNLFQDKTKINLVYVSGQNIDRLVSIYKACRRTGKTMVVDVYIANVLKELSRFADIHRPSDNFTQLKVIYPYFLSKRIADSGKKELLYRFKKWKVTKEEINNSPGSYVLCVRPSMKKDLDHIPRMDGGNLIYSLWEGYLNKPATKRFIDYLTNRGFTIHKIHTSGHADLPTLKAFVNAIDPKHIIPIHTFAAKEYKKHFSQTVITLKDRQELIVN